MRVFHSIPVDAITPEDNAKIAEIRDVFGVSSQIALLVEWQHYAVSECARVFTWAKTTRHRQGQLREISQTDHKLGYKSVAICGNKNKCRPTMHRLLACLFLPQPSAAQNKVRHLNGDPRDNRLCNLAWGTQSENMADCIRHGRTLKGCKNPGAKLNDRRVRIIRDLVLEGFAQETIAHFFGVSRTTVSQCVNGAQWSHVKNSES